MAELPEHLHRAFFRAMSLLSPRGQGVFLRRYFDWWHRTPDPWKLGTDAYERRKYDTTLGEVPRLPYRRILEVGCAEGVFTDTLVRRFPEARVTGIDISARALDRARQRAARARFVHADLLSHGLEEEFDLVFCAETLYYIGRADRLRRASRRLTGLLADGGVLVLVHPWPEARSLHRFADEDPAVWLIARRVDTETHRPFAVAVYRKPDQAAGEVAASREGDRLPE
ncbi:class I SAM-dependent methyltransferase [Nonomuraea sp. NPDC003804]|uniref:class I SAM-dependent methyltransferase n=1 Tax=Nonomuraea sp. NPDC003804 TaxID=3154547 RepID=UPI0033A1FEE0